MKKLLVVGYVENIIWIHGAKIYFKKYLRPQFK